MRMQFRSVGEQDVRSTWAVLMDATATRHARRWDSFAMMDYDDAFFDDNVCV